MIEDWYVARFMRLRSTAFRDPAAYFHQYANLSPEAARARALEIWRTINLKNLEENILPTRQRARPHPAQGGRPPRRVGRAAQA